MSSLDEKIYCDYKCPLHEQCGNYRQVVNKRRMTHWGVNPFNYEKNKCVGFEQMTSEDIAEIIIATLNPDGK
jgi:hypothetical protein